MNHAESMDKLWVNHQWKSLTGQPRELCQLPISEYSLLEFASWHIYQECVK